MLKLSYDTPTQQGGILFAMNKITQTMRFRQSLIEYSKKYGVTKAAIKYKTNRQYIYRWLRRYDGTLQSLADQSRRPHHHPNQHTGQELKLIRDMRRRNPTAGLVVFWVKLRQRGYERTIPGLYRVLRRQGEMAVKPPNPKYIPKPYETMYYPGQRIQIDVKHVPASCIVGCNGEKYYQYTAIDEFSRFRYLEAFPEANTFTSAQFLEHSLKQSGIRHKLIRPFTPRHNGKVERSHRKDNEYFYATHKFYSFDDFKAQLAVLSRKYNSFSMRPLKWQSPKKVLHDFLAFGVTYY